MPVMITRIPLTSFLLLFLLNGITAVWAQTGAASLPSLLEALGQHYAQLQQLATALDDNTRTRETLREEADRLNEENGQLDQQLAGYHSALETLNQGIDDYTRNCAGQALDNEALSTCETQRIRLEARNNELTAQFEQLSARETLYSASVENINRRENERALAAQQIISRYQQAESAFDQVITALVQIDPLSQACVALEPEDTYPCMQQFWNISN